MSEPQDEAPSLVGPVLASLATLGYAVVVVLTVWASPDKGFTAFTGRKVVQVAPYGAVAAAGVRPGDVVVAVDGVELRSTLDYADRVLARKPGERLTLEFRKRGSDRRVRAEVLLQPVAAPIPSLLALASGFVLVTLGLVARAGRPKDLAAVRFHRVALGYAFLFSGGLSWTHLLVHPWLALVCVTALFVAPSLATDFVLTFPVRPRRSPAGYRVAAYLPSLLLFVGVLGGIALAAADHHRGAGGDRGLRLVAFLIGAQLLVMNLEQALALKVQLASLRELSGEARAQAKWLVLGFAGVLVPAAIAVPVAARDLAHFMAVGYQPFVLLMASLFFGAATLAVLRVRLADVDLVIRRSVGYTLATGGAAAIYLGLVLAASIVADRLAEGLGLLPHLVAASATALLFPVLARRAMGWIDRRYYRDRLHYVQALRELAVSATRLREPAELAADVVGRATAALRAARGALYLAEGGALRLVHAVGDGFPPGAADPAALAAAGLVVPIERERLLGALVLGDRLGGDLYSSQDRDLLAAVAGQLAVAFENAGAYATIAAMNREIQELRERLEDENRYLRGRLDAARRTGEAIVGSSRTIRELRATVERVAATAAAVLVHGESGTGKGLVARALHAASPRADGPFIHVDCGAIAPGVVESELFGHERGAFTGAVRNRRGHFELADGGTIFLDEIGELPLALQPKLLRVLQDQSFVRVGGSQPVKVNVRVIAATNRDLAAAAQRGAFREDLYYRLAVIELHVPPLRSRKGDLPELVDALLPEVCRRHHQPARRLGPGALERLLAYGWPGNVRELENVLERAAVLADGPEILPRDLALPDAPPPVEVLEATAVPDDASHHDVMDVIEKRRIVAALRSAGGNRTRAAESLGIPRTTLTNKLRRHGLL